MIIKVHKRSEKTTIRQWMQRNCSSKRITETKIAEFMIWDTLYNSKGIGRNSVGSIHPPAQISLLAEIRKGWTWWWKFCYTENAPCTHMHPILILSTIQHVNGIWKTHLQVQNTKTHLGITLIPTHSKQNSRLQTWECRLEITKHPSREESQEDAHLEPKLRIGLPVIAKDGPTEVGIHPYALQVQQPAAWGHVYGNLLKMPQTHVRKLDRRVRSGKAYNQERASSTPTIQSMLKFQSHHFTFYCTTPCTCLFTYKEVRIQSFKLEQPWVCCSSKPPQRKVDISHLG